MNGRRPGAVLYSSTRPIAPPRLDARCQPDGCASDQHRAFQVAHQALRYLKAMLASRELSIADGGVDRGESTFARPLPGGVDMASAELITTFRSYGSRHKCAGAAPTGDEPVRG